MGWIAALLTLIAIVLVIAGYVWLSQRGLKRSLESGRSTDILRGEEPSRPVPWGVEHREGDDSAPAGSSPTGGGNAKAGGDAGGTAAAEPVALMASDSDKVASAPASAGEAAKEAKPKTTGSKSKAAKASGPKSSGSKSTGSKASLKAAPGKKAASAKKGSGAKGKAAGDDLTLISGIGPVYKKKLAAEGITAFQQVADLSAADMAALDERLDLGGRAEREEWIIQAKDLLAGKPPRAKAERAAMAAKGK